MALKITIVAVVGLAFFFTQPSEGGNILATTKSVTRFKIQFISIPFQFLRNSAVSKITEPIRVPVSIPPPTGTPIPLSPPSPTNPKLCGKTPATSVLCKWNEECSHCGQNNCNTYTCKKPKPTCQVNCLIFAPKCVCQPYYRRSTPNGPCVRIPLVCIIRYFWETKFSFAASK